jgi:hypothetical protein
MSHEAHLETELYKKVLAYPPVFSNEIIENYNHSSVQDDMRFVVKKEIIPSGSINVNTIVGSDNEEYTGLSWKELLVSGEKMREHILQAESNPEYYHNKNIKEGIAFITVDDKNYTTGTGNNRSCIAKFLLFNAEDSHIHGVRITKYSIDNSILEQYKTIKHLFSAKPYFKHITFKFKETIERQSSALTYEYDLKFTLHNTRADKEYTVLFDEFSKIEEAVKSYKWTSKFYTNNNYLEAILE